MFAADLDGDGDLDVLSASSMTTRSLGMRIKDRMDVLRTVLSRLFPPMRLKPFSVFAADLDGDGDLDVLSASLGDNKIAWYENQGSNAGFTNSSQHVIATNAVSGHSVFAADLDGDGDLDVLSAS